MARAWASTMEISNAFCSPVEQEAAAADLGPWVTRKSLRWGPWRVRPAPRSRAREFTQHLTIMVLDLDSRRLGQHGLDFAGDSQTRPGKGRAGNLLTGGAPQSLQSGEPAGSQGNGRFGHLLLDAGKPARVPSRFGHQAVALAHELIECQRPAAMFGIEDRRQPVEKAAARRTPDRRTADPSPGSARRSACARPSAPGERLAIPSMRTSRPRPVLPLALLLARRSAAERSGKS